MGRRGARRRVERGIYSDAIGFEVVAWAGTKQRSKRFPKDTDRDALREWRDSTAADLRDEQQPTEDTRTLTGAVAAYVLKTGLKPGHPIRASLNAWTRAHGSLERRKLTPAMAAQMIERWKLEGYSPQSLYYRRFALRKLWHALDGPRVRTPVDAIVVKRPKGQRPVWVSDETILAVLLQLRKHEILKRQRNAKTRARFLVLVTTGQRPSQLKRTRRGDVEFYRTPQDGIHGVWWVRSAKGGEPTPVYLNAEMRTAWEAFVVAKAWGNFDKRNFARTLRRCGWPAGVRPYNVRHATGLTLSERGIDLSDISAHMGHTDLKTTRTFYVPQLHSRLKRVSAALEGRFSAEPLARSLGTPKKR